MPHISEAAARTLRALLGQEVTDDPVGALMLPTAAGPTLVKVQDPVDLVETALARLDEEENLGPQPNEWLERMKHRRGLHPDADRRMILYDGRECCLRFAEALNARLHNLAIPSEHTCPGCGAVYRIEIRTREARHHGR
jgi:hypothetical protein